MKKEKENLLSDIDILKQQLNDMQNQLNDSQVENDLLHEKVQESDIVNLFDNECKIYTHMLQECVYKLLSHNVTTSHVSPVIEIVLKLVNKKPNKLPSTSTINNMNVQRLILAQKQLGKNMQIKKHFSFK